MTEEQSNEVKVHAAAWAVYNGPMSNKTTVASLFSGAGGMDIGFRDAGFEIVWANDIDKDACETHRRWSSSEVVCADVCSVGATAMPKTDVIVGGFPCQGFSLGGPRQVNDDRNVMYRHFVRCVEHHRPIAFVAENVKGILSIGGGHAVVRKIMDDFERLGYVVVNDILDASRLGVPQERERVIFVGMLAEAFGMPSGSGGVGDLESPFRFPSHSEVATPMSSVLSGLPEPDPADVCADKFSPRYMSRNRRRDWGEPSFTIPAMAKQVPLHPSSPPMRKRGKDEWEFGDGSTRRLSWREAALVQTFPATLEFAGDLRSKYRQVGNAVPCELARRVASSLMAAILTARKPGRWSGAAHASTS